MSMNFLNLYTKYINVYFYYAYVIKYGTILLEDVIP